VDAWTLWRGHRDTTRLAFRVLLVLSLVLHLPLTPLSGLFGLWRALDAGAPADIQEITGIPVDLLEEEEGIAAPPVSEPPPEPLLAPPEPAAPEKDPEAPRPDQDAGAPDAGPEDGPEDAGPEDAGPEDAGAQDSDAGLADPIALKGAVRDLSDPNLNVELRVYTSRVRKQPLGPRVGRLLGSIYQWRDFFGPANIDPIQDVDQILVLGPQLRDSSQVLAALRLKLPEARIREALDHLVRADTKTGHWVEGAPIPLAVAQADRAPRVFAMAGSGVVVVVPPKLQDEVARKAKLLVRTLRDTAGVEVLRAKVRDPANALRGVFVAPPSIKVAKVYVLPTADGGAEVLIEAEDENPEAAEQSAEYLQRQVTAATELDLGGLGALVGLGKTRFVDVVSFTAKENTIVGRIVINRKQLEMALDMVEAYIVKPAQPKKSNKDAGR
jgi:hypothetical protein